MNKTVSLVIALILIASMVIVVSSSAQSIPKPSSPGFTVSFVDRSYTAPIISTQTTDPFTGQQSTQTSGGNYVKNQTVDIKITNPQLRSVTLQDGTEGKLYYTIRTKAHFSDIWWDSNVPWTSTKTYEDGNSFGQIFASTSDYTTLTLVIGSPNDIIMGYSDVYIPAGGKEDFQVKASYGYQYTTYAGLYPSGSEFTSYADSGWSDTKTLEIPSGNSPVPTSTVPELPIYAIMFLIVAVPIMLLATFRKRVQCGFGVGR